MANGIDPITKRRVVSPSIARERVLETLKPAVSEANIRERAEADARRRGEFAAKLFGGKGPTRADVAGAGDKAAEEARRLQAQQASIAMTRAEKGLSGRRGRDVMARLAREEADVRRQRRLQQVLIDPIRARGEEARLTEKTTQEGRMELSAQEADAAMERIAKEHANSLETLERVAGADKAKMILGSELRMEEAVKRGAVPGTPAYNNLLADELSKLAIAGNIRGITTLLEIRAKAIGDIAAQRAAAESTPGVPMGESPERTLEGIEALPADVGTPAASEAARVRVRETAAPTTAAEIDRDVLVTAAQGRNTQSLENDISEARAQLAEASDPAVVRRLQAVIEVAQEVIQSRRTGQEEGA